MGNTAAAMVVRSAYVAGIMGDTVAAMAEGGKVAATPQLAVDIHRCLLRSAA
jgi:hypothetical protein